MGTSFYVGKEGLPRVHPLWHPPIELLPAEHTIIKRIRRAKLFVFLRHHCHKLFAGDLVFLLHHIQVYFCFAFKTTNQVYICQEKSQIKYLGSSHESF
jgi:hypothetical protein